MTVTPVDETWARNEVGRQRRQPSARVILVVTAVVGRQSAAASDATYRAHGLMLVSPLPMNMDLYKHAFRLSPMIASELVADCFELACDIRELDMRASPYDLTGLRLDPDGEEWTPIKIETPEGKHEYVAAQKLFAARGRELRARLIAECGRLLGAAS